MVAATETLTEREKETLRLLLRGHDAKSIARNLNLSVHTVNERLRDARQKLGVSSSREAARVLARFENADPNFLGDIDFGVVAPRFGGQEDEHKGHRNRASRLLPWFGGGMLMLSLIVAAVVMISSGEQTKSVVIASAKQPKIQVPASARPAQEWLRLVDDKNWAESWSKTGNMFRSQVSQESWTSKVMPVRQPLGTVSSRSFNSVVRTTSLPGAPIGNYEVLEFLVDFANKRGAIETVVLVNEGAAWKVVGYFIR
jgi:DNA-binding CsgD family transcriptional regulator